MGVTCSAWGGGTATEWGWCRSAEYGAGGGTAFQRVSRKGEWGCGRVLVLPWYITPPLMLVSSSSTALLPSCSRLSLCFEYRIPYMHPLCGGSLCPICRRCVCKNIFLVHPSDVPALCCRMISGPVTRTEGARESEITSCWLKIAYLCPEDFRRRGFEKSERERDRERERGACSNAISLVQIVIWKKVGKWNKKQKKGEAGKLRGERKKKKRQVGGIIPQLLVKIVRIWPAAIILGQTFVLSRCRVFRTVSVVVSPRMYALFRAPRKGNGSVT